jgi:hypothetical protein
MATDRWDLSGAAITAPETLARLRFLLEETPVIVEHRYFRGARTPTRVVFDDADAFELYVREQTRPGDHVLVWSFVACCTDDNVSADGKIPDAEGRTPVGGAY